MFFFWFQKCIEYEFVEIVLEASNTTIKFQRLRYAETKLFKPGQHVTT